MKSFKVSIDSLSFRKNGDISSWKWDLLHFPNGNLSDDEKLVADDFMIKQLDGKYGNLIGQKNIDRQIAEINSNTKYDCGLVFYVAVRAA